MSMDQIEEGKEYSPRDTLNIEYWRNRISGSSDSKNRTSPVCFTTNEKMR